MLSLKGILYMHIIYSLLNSQPTIKMISKIPPTKYQIYSLFKTMLVFQTHDAVQVVLAIILVLRFWNITYLNIFILSNTIVV